MKCELEVTGMRCGGCELLVKEALGELDGIENVDVSHAAGRVSLEFDPLKVSLEKIKAVIGEQGFSVSE